MNDKFFKKPFTLPLIATLCCALWGSAPSCIKLGYSLFQIESSQTMNIMLFAGVRFFLAGFLVILGYSLICRKPVIPGKTSLKPILCLAMAQTAVQYILYYVGAANASGVTTSMESRNVSPRKVSPVRNRNSAPRRASPLPSVRTSSIASCHGE